MIECIEGGYEDGVGKDMVWRCQGIAYLKISEYKRVYILYRIMVISFDSLSSSMHAPQ